jgi:hypothetical protein
MCCRKDDVDCAVAIQIADRQDRTEQVRDIDGIEVLGAVATGRVPEENANGIPSMTDDQVSNPVPVHIER